MLRYLTAGESHGQSLVGTIEGIPANVQLTTDTIRAELARRRLGVGRGARMRFEADEVTVLTGLRHGQTLGSPIAIKIDNTEWEKWEQVMSADPLEMPLAETARNAPLCRPRPGHADLPGMVKYGFEQAREVLERASARETAARVALGAVAKAFLLQSLGIEIFSHVVALGGIACKSTLPKPADLPVIDADPVRCFDVAASAQIQDRIAQAKSAGDTLGGVVEVLAYGLPVGIGSHIQWDKRLDSRLAAALMGIQAIKGVEIGDGFALAALPGSQAHDEIWPAGDGCRKLQVQRKTNHAGGIEGGISNGEILRIKAAMKPIATVPNALNTIDVTTGESALAHHQRSDITAVPAAGVVAEAMVSLVIAEFVLEKYGGDSLTEVRAHISANL